MPRFRSVLVAALASVCLLASCSDAQPPAARVGGVEITDTQVADAAALFGFLADIGQTPCGQVVPGGGDTEVAACSRLALTNLIEFEVVKAYAEANGIEPVADEVDQAVEEIERQIGTEPFEEQLGKSGTTRDELRALARSFSVLRQVATAVTEEELGDDGIAARYEQDIATYTTVQVDHVLVETEAEADEIYAEVTAPGMTREDFLAIAKERSIDPSAAQNSGSLGSALVSTYAPEFANAVLALEPGEIGLPVQTEFGWHVVRLERSDTVPLRVARPRIVEQAAVEIFPAWLREELEDDLEVNPRYGRFDIDMLTVVRIDSTDPSSSDAGPSDLGTSDPGTSP